MAKKDQQMIKASSQKLRPMGDILLDMEPLILEMCNDHDLQWSDVLNLVKGYLEVHCPGAREEYTAGGHPQFYYGPVLSIKGDSDES